MRSYSLTTHILMYNIYHHLALQIYLCQIYSWTSNNKLFFTICDHLLLYDRRNPHPPPSSSPDIIAE